MIHTMPTPDAQPIPLSAEQIAALLPHGHLLDQFAQMLLDFRSAPINPAATQKLEIDMQGFPPDRGFSALQDTLNPLEPNDPEVVPAELKVGGTCYRRRDKSPRTVDSTFGR